MTSENTILTIAFIAVFVSVVGTAFTYYTISDFKESWLSGFATFGTVNLTVETAALINFTTDIIDFGSGKVNSGSPNATLNTAAGASNVTNGNWTLQNRGYMVIENIGNNNVTLNIYSDKTAAQFVGGTSPLFQINVTSLESNSCTNTSDGGINMSSGAYIEGFFSDVNVSQPGQRVCDRLSFSDSRDTARLDIRLVVPSDGQTGALGARLTASFAATN